jgi:hypothetical protein
MRLTGPLTAAAGVLLAVVTVLQATYLLRVSARVRGQCARAELRGLSEALRWRLEGDLHMRDHNAPAMRRALSDLVSTSPALEWAALYEPDGRRLAAGGPALEVSAEHLRSANAARPEALPELQRLEGEGLLGLTRLQVAEREMVLAAGFAAAAPQPAAGRLAALVAGALIAGLAASLLLVTRGAIETYASRRKSP